MYCVGMQGPHTGRRSDFIMLATASSNALAGRTPTSDAGSAVITTHPLAVPQSGLELRCSGGAVHVAVASGAAGGSEELLQTVGVAQCGSGEEAAVVAWMGESPLVDLQSAVLTFTLGPGATLYSFSFV